MPRVDVVFYMEEDGKVPALEWIERMARRDKRIAAKCQERIERLAELGHELRRPDADFLHDGNRTGKGYKSGHRTAQEIRIRSESAYL
jgi:hypothetical protein